MHILNGKEAAIKIRQYEKENNLSPSIIFIVSGHCNQRMIDEFLDPRGPVYANEFLKKPLMYHQLSEIIRKYAQ